MQMACRWHADARWHADGAERLRALTAVRVQDGYLRDAEPARRGDSRLRWAFRWAAALGSIGRRQYWAAAALGGGSIGRRQHWVAAALGGGSIGRRQHWAAALGGSAGPLFVLARVALVRRVFYALALELALALALELALELARLPPCGRDL